ncbi:CMGC family protein kinase [Tritrichomonas foetus]|uniref:CMGC family protein kinase n=1 Tax=Tritrichomonas foetus TaxID=1144522 RepID=A0A1J4KFZ2_9EUKA|nr:CMGC family protein kinase [Tritrichomonas foetus]|eukprot:OHT08700.1 CMGC family protein kinase [Tritrichomonas foetus]
MEQAIFGPDFTVLGKLGEGSFAEVFKVKSRQTNEIFAIKRLKKRCRSIEEANRLPEISALKALQGHPNIVKLLDVLYDSSHGYLAIVFEMLDKNLYELIRDHKHAYDEKTCLVLAYQLLKAVANMHSKNLFHRDIKPENCMVNKNTFELKLVDFGSTRLTNSRGPFTEYVSTRWYRAPECILTAGSYGPAVDIWAVGCVLFEIITTRPLFPGKHELDQICRIHNILGTPGREILSRFNQNPNTQISFSFPPRYAQDLQSLMPSTSPVVVDLIKALLTYNPVDRITAEEALNHPAFEQIRREEDRWRSSGMNVPLPVYILKTQPNPISRPTHGYGKVPQIYQPIQNNPQQAQVQQLQQQQHQILQQGQMPNKSLNAKILDSRRIAAERIKAYNQKHLAEQQQQKQLLMKKRYPPALHLGMAKVVKQKVNPNLIVQPTFQKPKPELIQPRLPPLGHPSI